MYISLVQFDLVTLKLPCSCWLNLFNASKSIKFYLSLFSSAASTQRAVGFHDSAAVFVTCRSRIVLLLLLPLASYRVGCWVASHQERTHSSPPLLPVLCRLVLASAAAIKCTIHLRINLRRFLQSHKARDAAVFKPGRTGARRGAVGSTGHSAEAAWP